LGSETKECLLSCLLSAKQARKNEDERRDGVPLFCHSPIINYNVADRPLGQEEIMFCSRQLSVIAALFLTASLGYLAAQARPNPHSSNKEESSRQADNAERTRAFLGLGPAPDLVAAARGEKLFGSNCAFCHGVKATGAEGSDLVRSAAVLHDERGELIGPIVLKGRPEKGMPSFPSFTQAQIYDIAEFLHSRVEAVANRGLYTVQGVVTGDAKKGEEYFNGTGRCKTCHSPIGDLAQVASRFQPADLQAAFLYPASVTSFEMGSARPSSPTLVTVTFPSGESISGTLKRLDDFNVSMYDASGTYHSWSRAAGIKVMIKDPLAAHRELLQKYTDADMHDLLAYLVTLK
jgi:cytochrome c oxidase cbb3-type subunit III